MKPFIKWIGGILLMFISLQNLQAQTDTLCNPNENRKIFGELNFNYGSATNSYSQFNRSTFVVGQPIVSPQNMLSLGFQAGFGIYSAWALPPQPPILVATQGDFKDRIKLSWNVNPLSPVPTGFVIYRDGSYLADLGQDVRQFLDFNVQAGEYYEYSIIAKNVFGSGSENKSVGFVNPNGVVSGKIETNSGNPVPGVEVRLTPLTGSSMSFDGVDDELCVSYNDKLPTDKFTVSAYVKLASGNNESGIIDWGSGLNSNWWITSTGSTEAKGYIFHIGNGTSSDSLKYFIPNEISNPERPNQWHQVTMIFNGTAMSVMVDGEFVGTKPAIIQRTKNYLNIGSKIGAGGFFSGKIDDIRVYNRPLTQTEVKATKNRSVSKNENGLVAYWKMDEGVGQKVFDNSAIPTIANIYGGATFSTDIPEVYNAGISDVTGYYVIDGINYSGNESFRATPMKNFDFNSAVEFNAADKSYGNLTNYDIPDTSTVEVLFHPFDLKSRQTVLSKGSLYELYVDDAKLYLNLNGNITDLGIIKAKYYHVAVAMDNTAGTAKVYLEGELSATVSFTGTSNWATGNPWLIATNSTDAGTGKFYTGLIDEVAIYKTALPQNEIQRHFVTGIPQDSTTALLYSYFDLNEGSDTKVYDYAAISFGATTPREGTLTKANWSNNVRRSESEPHEFEPNVRVVNLNTSNTAVGNIDFKDVSTVNVSGYVRFANTFCFEKQIEILVNGQSNIPAIYTDKNGKWTADFEPGRTMKLSAVYKDHLFSPSFFELRKLQAPKAGIVFLDNTKRFVKGQIAGGECRKSILPVALDANSYQVLKIESTNGCFSRIDTLRNPDGKYNFDNLPAIAFETKYLFHSYDNTIQGFFNNKGGQQTDLRDVAGDTLDFIYTSSPKVKIDTSKIPVDKCNNLILQQSLSKPDSLNPNKYLNIKFITYEEYYGGTCLLDSVNYTVNNDIGDKPQETFTSYSTEMVYKAFVGVPNILEPYTKKLQVVAEHNGSLATNSIDVRVFGMLSRPASFTTSSKPDPYLILRDPPGDASSATIEAGATKCQKIDRSWVNNVGGGANVEFAIGEITKTVVGGPGIAKIEEAGVESKFTVSTNTSYTNEGSRAQEFCITTTKAISTSGSDDFVGRDADIFAGNGINFKVGINDRISLGADSCTVKADSLVWISPNGFDTEYIYTRKHINEDVIPSLNLIINSSTVSDSAKAKARLALDNWSRVMILDSLLLLKSDEAKENISFDAGVSYTKTITTESIEENNVTHTFDIGTEVTYETSEKFLFFSGGGGWSLNYGHTENWGSGDSKTESVSFSYNLADDDPGDNFSVDIFQFKALPDQSKSEDDIKKDREKKFDEIRYTDALWKKSQVDSLNTKQAELIAQAKTAQEYIKFYNGLSDRYVYYPKKNKYDPSKDFRIFPITDSEKTDYKVNKKSLDNFPDYTETNDFKAYVRSKRVLQLPKWVSPAFKISAGESMCPWEGTVTKNANTGVETWTGTLNREQVSLSVDKNVQINIPKNTPAVYHLKLGNIGSAIKEQDQLTYKLGVVSGTNPRGAEVKVNGFNITEPIPFVLNSREVLDATLTIEKGPEDFDYEKIKVAFYSECEVGTPNQNSKDDVSSLFYQEVSLDVHFIEPCSPVDISYPLQNFVSTPGDLNKLSISLVEYDKNDADLKDISVQYRRVDGDGAWINIQKFLPADLGDLQTNLLWNTELLRDDYYEIRAITGCNNVALAPGISTIIRGKLERQPPELVGIPEPGDGTWDPGDEISITFNEPINCDKVVQADILANNTIGLYDATTNALVDATITCVGNKIVIVPNINPVFYENRAFRVVVSGKDYDDAKLLENPNHQAAAIRDKAGNMIPKTIKWEFAVNQNNLEWVGTDVIETNTVLQPFSVKRQVRNRGGSIASFRMESVPSWLTVSPSTGTLNPGQVADVTLTFQQDLLIGDYLDTLNLVGSKGAEPLLIDYRVRCTAPNYVVDNPSQYEGSMNMVIDLSIFGITSTDPSDIIIAKIDGQIRGVGKVAYYRNLPADKLRWLTFMTIYANGDDNDKPIEFRVWDGDKCNEYADVLEAITYQESSLLGSPLEPTQLHVLNLVNKCIPLNKGWNWVSFNLDLGTGNNTVANVLSSIKGKTGALIKDDNLFSKYYGTPINDWKNTLKNIVPQKRYMVYVAQKDTICIKGTPYKASEFPVNIVNGWNWVGYVPSTGASVSQALKGLTPLNGDIIKSQTLFAQYVAGVGWIGNLNFLEPLKGYLLKISNTGTLTYPSTNSFTSLANETASAAQIAQEAPMTYDFTQYQSTMTLIGKVNGIAINADDELRAYIDGKLSGINKSISYAKDKLFFQTIYHQDKLNVSFKLYKADRKKEYELNRIMTFKADSLAGMVGNPVIFDLLTTNNPPVTIVLEDQLIKQPDKIFQNVSIKNGVVESGSNCTTFAFNTILPIDILPKPTCNAETGLEGNMIGVMKVNYNERSTFVSSEDVISFVNPANGHTVGCASFDSDFGLFNYTVKGGTSSTETPIDVVYYSDLMKKSFTVKSGVMYKNNKELGDYLTPYPLDFSPLSVTSDINGTMTVVMRDTSWTGKYCVDAFAMNCTGFNDGQTSVCFQRLKQGDCVDLIVRKVTETTNNIVQALTISSKVIVNTGVRLEYKGGNVIELKPGFETKSGTIFTGVIEGCNNKH